jgi:hypothetical protein
MKSLTDSQVAEYFHRCYKAVDGLWFMKVEAKYSFDAALNVDEEVWKVMPKIQARMIKSMLRKGEAQVTLLESLNTKLSLEGFKFKIEQDEKGFRILISDCPWHNLMVKSDRERLSKEVGTTICNAEYSVWISEFRENIKFSFRTQKCKGSEKCILDFKRV